MISYNHAGMWPYLAYQMLAESARQTRAAVSHLSCVQQEGQLMFAVLFASAE